MVPLCDGDSIKLAGLVVQPATTPLPVQLAESAKVTVAGPVLVTVKTWVDAVLGGTVTAWPSGVTVALGTLTSTQPESSTLPTTAYTLMGILLPACVSMLPPVAVTVPDVPGDSCSELGEAPQLHTSPPRPQTRL